MNRYRLSRRAKADLAGIWRYTERKWGSEQANTYLDTIFGALDALAADPSRGRPCDDIHTGYFRYAVGSHIAFYRRVGADIGIVRILHQRMDFERHL